MMNELSYIDYIPLYNSRMVQDFINYIKTEYPDFDVEKLVNGSTMEWFEIEDDGHWFTRRQMDLFYQEIDRNFTDPDIYRKAGRFFARTEQNAILKQYILGSIDTSKAYESIERSFRLLTRATEFKTRKLASNRVEIVMTHGKGGIQSPHYCENLKGYLESISILFKNRMTRIEHTACTCTKGQNCRYTVSWKETTPNRLRKARNVSAGILLPLGALLMFLFPSLAVLAVCTACLGIMFLVSILADHKEKSEIKLRFQALKSSVDIFVDQARMNYQNALMTNELGYAMGKQDNVDGTLEHIIKILKKRLSHDRCVIFLTDRSEKILRFRGGFGYSRSQREFLKKTNLSLEQPNSNRIFASVFAEKKPMIINHIQDVKGNLSRQAQTLIDHLEAESILICPVICNHVSIGILVVDNLKSKKPLLTSDMSRLMGVASMIGSSIRSADLFAARERLFKSILRVMTASIDAHDPATSGHSERVTEYALGICREMGLSKDYCEMIQIAALLHDYGKIGVPEAILKKPGRLTPKEFEIVKTHTEKTKNILEQINFEGIFSQVPLITGSHHEKFDGTGYPNGLKGKKIPFGARVLAVADFFEAVTTKRHYRGPMQYEKALEIMKDETDKHFDKEIVEAFISYYTKKNVDHTMYHNNKN